MPVTRIVEHDATGPALIRKDAVSGPAIHVCWCGLTSTPPLCDGSRRLTPGESPGRLVRYVRTKASWPDA